MLPKVLLASRFSTLLAAVLIGLAESTGMAPPSPIVVEEQVVWIAPDSDGDADRPFEITFDPTHPDVEARSKAPTERADLSRSHLDRLLAGLRHEF